MAIERKKISFPSSANCEVPDELDKLLRDGWQVKYWRHDPFEGLTYYMLEREVPDHGTA